MFLLKLPHILGFIIAMLATVAVTGIFFIIVHGFLRGKRPDTTRIFAQQMAMRVGTIHALIISLIFGFLSGKFNEQQETLDIEAAIIGNIYVAMSNIRTDEAAKIRNQLILHLADIIDKEWQQTPKNPFSASTDQFFIEAFRTIQDWQASSPFEEKIKNYTMDMILKIAEMRTQRLLSWYQEEVPMIFWLIAVPGFILTLVPYLSVELNKFRFFLISCYASIIGLTFYGIILLSNPFMSGLLSPTPYEMIYKQIKASSLAKSARVLSSRDILSENVRSDSDLTVRTKNTPWFNEK